MSRKIISIIFGTIMISGLILLLYPATSDYLNAKNQSKAIADYTEYIEEISEEDYSLELQKAYDYNKKLSETKDALYYPDKVEGYDDILDVYGNGIMAFVSIPKINVKLPVYHGTNDAVLNGAIGHLKGSSFPVGGESTNAVIAAHRGLPSAGLFTDLDQLEIGDEFTVTVFDQILIYEVDRISVVLPEETSELEIVPGEDHVTLQTCTPYGVNSHRLLVRGVRIGTASIDDDEHETEQTLFTTIVNKRNLIPISVASLIITSTAIILIVKTKRNK